MRGVVSAKRCVRGPKIRVYVFTTTIVIMRPSMDTKSTKDIKNTMDQSGLIKFEQIHPEGCVGQKRPLINRSQNFIFSNFSSHCRRFVSVLVTVFSIIGFVGTPVMAQTAAQAALGLANALDGAGGGVSRDDLLAALEDAAEAGRPMALWRLGMMYENGEGVEQDRVKAFGYFSRIANDNANTSPKSFEAEIVAQSFVKVGEYYRDGLPDAGIEVDHGHSNALMLHAASYFGDADAQYRVGRLFLEENGMGMSPVQGARWLSLAARKGHAAAQARLGDLLFNGQGVAPQPVEGLMWLNVANHHAVGTSDEVAVSALLNRAMSVASVEQRAEALAAADSLGERFGGY